MEIDQNSEAESNMSESLTANPVTPYEQVSSPMSNYWRGHDRFSDNPVPDAVPSRSNSSDTGSDDHRERWDENQNEMSLGELLYSTSSYHAIVTPVSITMTLAALAAVYINNEMTMEMGEEQFATAYNVWKIDDSSGGASNGKHLAASIVNTFVMITVIAAMTFGIVILYKYRCMTLLIGYMVMSSASLLGLLGDYMGSVAIEIYRIPIDVVSYTLLIYNFAIVGVTAIFYQKGIPSSITQMYLVCTSVILAWHLSHFDDWTAWTLLVMLALYDLCAVLSPCGPLKALVNLMQEKGSPEMPGLLYEAQLPAGAARPIARSRTNNSNDANDDASDGSSSEDESSVGENIADESRNSYNPNLSSSSPASSGRKQPPPAAAFQMEGTDNHVAEPETPLTNRSRGNIPLALARIYKLKLASGYGTNSSSRRRGRRTRRNRDGDDTSSINVSPLLADASPEEFYQQTFTVAELVADVEVEFPQNGGWIEKIAGGDNGRDKYQVFGRDGELRRTLVVSRKGKVYEISNDEDDDDNDDDSQYVESSSIRLGLGDFIFYSVMVAKAAMYSFTTFSACMLVILAGLGGTLVLLSVYHSALPALPISIFLGVFFYLVTKTLIEPWIEVIMTSPIYV